MTANRLLFIVACLFYLHSAWLIGAEDHADKGGAGRQSNDSATLPIKCDPSGFEWNAPMEKEEPLYRVRPAKVETTVVAPYALFRKAKDSHYESRTTQIDVGYSETSDVEVVTGHHLEVVPKINETFEKLLGHALACQARGDTRFLKELRERISRPLAKANETGGDFLRKRYDFAAEKYIYDREETSPKYHQDVETLSGLQLQLQILEGIEKGNSEYYEALVDQIRINASGKKAISKLMMDYVLHCRELTKKEMPKEGIKEAGVITSIQHTSLLDSLLNPVQAAFYRQLLKLGPDFVLAVPPKGVKEFEFVKNPSYRESPEVVAALKSALPEQSAYLNDKAKLENPAPKARIAYWNDFEKNIEKEIEKMNPERLTSYQQRLETGLKEIDQSPAKDSPHSALAREALIRASRVVELKTADPLADRRSPIEKALRGNYSDHMSSLGVRLGHELDPAKSEIDKVLKNAEAIYKIKIPMDAANRIRTMDPILLGIVSKQLGELDLRNFFLTGHSTALFDLRDKKLAAAFKKGIEAKLKGYALDSMKTSRSGVPQLGEKIDSTLFDLMDIAMTGRSKFPSEYSNGSDVIWKESYPRVRAKLMESLFPILEKAKASGGFRTLTPEQKAALYAIESIDSMGNHGVNPYNAWKEPALSGFYEVEAVAERLLNEHTLAKKNNMTEPGQIERQLADIVLEDPKSDTPYSGVPSHGRTAVLQRLAEPNGATETRALKFYSDLMKKHAVAGASGEKARDVIRSFAFDKNSPEQLELALTSQIPELGNLFTLASPPTPEEGLKEHVLRALRKLADFPIDKAALAEQVKKGVSKEGLAAINEMDKEQFELLLEAWKTTVEAERELLPLIKTNFAEFESQSKRHDKLESELMRSLKTDLINELAKIGGDDEPQKERKAEIGASIATLDQLDSPGSLLFWLRSDYSDDPDQQEFKDKLNEALSPAARQRLSSVLEGTEKERTAFFGKLAGQSEAYKSSGADWKKEYLTTLETELYKFGELSKAAVGVAKIRSQFGDSDPRVAENKSHLMRGVQNRFGSNSFTPEEIDSKVELAYQEHLKNIPLQESARRVVLKQFPYDLSWDVQNQAFVLDVNTAHITPELVRALAGIPGHRLILRDAKTGIDRPYGNGTSAMQDFIQNEPLELFTNGTSYPRGEWIPLNNRTAVRYVVQDDGSIKYELADRTKMQAKLQESLRDLDKSRNAYAEASEKYGNWTHGAEAFFRGLGNTYIRDPMTWSSPIGRPEASGRTKELYSTYSDYRGRVEQIKRFGLLDGGKGKTAYQSVLNENSEKGPRLLKREMENIQRYLDNAELTHDATLFLASLAVGGAGSFLAKGATTAEAAASGRLAAFLGRGASGRMIPFSAQVARGAVAYNTLLTHSVRTAGLLSGLPLAVGYGVEKYLVSSKMSEIQNKYQDKANKGKWRTHETMPEQGDAKYKGNFEEYKKDFLEWTEENSFDRNLNGVPDFLDPDFKAQAVTGPDNARFAQSLLGSQKAFFYMGLTGYALPGSGMLTHMFGGGIAQAIPDVIVGAPKKGNLLERQTLKDTVVDSATGTVTMLPGVVLQRVGMGFIPPSLQKHFKVLGLKTNTRELVGMGAFIAGNQGAHAAHNYISTGETPHMKGRDIPGFLASIAVEAYIGRGMAQHANAQMAKTAIEKMQFKDSQAAGLTEAQRASYAKENEAKFDALAKEFSKEAVDQAIFQMSARNIAQSNEFFLGEAGKYLERRSEELTVENAAKLKNNPYKDEPLDKLQAEIQVLTKELSGFKQFKLEKSVSGAKQQELKAKSEVLKARGTEAYMRQWSQMNEGQAHAQTLAANLYYLGTSEQAKANVRKAWVKQPEVAEALIQAADAVPASVRLGQRAGAAGTALDKRTGFIDQFARPDIFNPKDKNVSKYGEAVMLKAYAGAKTFAVKEALLQELLYSNPANLGNLKGAEVRVENPQDREAMQNYAAFRFMAMTIPNNGGGFVKYMENTSGVSMHKPKSLHEQFSDYLNSEQLITRIAALKVQRTKLKGSKKADDRKWVDDEIAKNFGDYQRVTGMELDANTLRIRTRAIGSQQ